ncbi:MAG TPA: hypothetical protein VNT52_00970 [Acidimicrobiales bacterium]|nr:hypothetical protein [Acidimicrobiales bacterium]
MAEQLFRIPLEPVPQRFEIDLAGVPYLVAARWNDAPEGGWFLDLYDAEGEPLAMGCPLVTGANLLEQLAHLGIPGVLAIVTDGDEDAPPTLGNLGGESNLYYLVTQ